MFNLDNEIKAYFLGFLQTDGSLDRKRASIEINAKDISILKAFAKEFGGKVVTRTRKTNFSDSCDLACWRLGSVDFVKEMNALGIPCGKKSNVVGPIPMAKELEIHYIRGLIDGDGSLCITGTNKPLIGFVTASEKMKEYLTKWLGSIGIASDIKRNKRDQIYSFCIFNEKAQTIARLLYQNCNVCLPRKMEIAQQIIAWERPSECRKVEWPKLKWTEADDAVLLQNRLNADLIHEQKLLPKRNKRSIMMRCWRLKNGRSNLRQRQDECTSKNLGKES